MLLFMHQNGTVKFVNGPSVCDAKNNDVQDGQIYFFGDDYVYQHRD